MSNSAKLAFYIILVLACVLIHKVLVDFMGLENWIFLMIGVLVFVWGLMWSVRKGNKP